MEMMEKLSFVFWFCSLGFWKRRCVREKIRCFSIIFETVWILFSLHFKAQKTDKKPFIFLFCSAPFLFHFFFFQHFSLFLHSHHCCLCSLFPFIFSFIFFCFSLLFLFSLFSILSLCLSHCFSFSHLCTSCFLISFFSIAVLVYPLLVLTHFSISPFVLDLFVFILLHLFFSASPCLFFFDSKKTKISVVNFSRWNCVFFFLNPPFFGVWSLVFSSLRRPYPLFVSCFYWFWAFLDITVLDFLLSNFFLGLFEKLSLFLDTTFKKYHWFLLWMYDVFFLKNILFLLS